MTKTNEWTVKPSKCIDGMHMLRRGTQVIAGVWVLGHARELAAILKRGQCARRTK